MKAKHIAKGLLTYVLPRWTYSRNTGGTNSARYCYAVFLRHLIRIHASTGKIPLGDIAELGPGDSLGIGLAALVAGAERYYAFDVAPFSDNARNVSIFDELVDLFARRADIPEETEFPEIKPAISSKEFPSHILNDESMRVALAPARIERLRSNLLDEVRADERSISYVAPWLDVSSIKEGTLDWIFSQAVMEHVDNLALTYEICSRWLKPGGVMSHQIDFRSHGTASTWDGHRAYGSLAWRMLRGARPYLINREPFSAHLLVPRSCNLELVEEVPIIRRPELDKDQLAPPFCDWSETDLSTVGAFVVHRRRTAD